MTARLAQFPVRTKVLLMALVLSVGVAFVYHRDQWILEKSLEGAAAAQIQALRDAGNDVVYDVTVSKEHVLFGGAQGKVRVFVRPAGPDPAIHAVEYFYERDGARWGFTGSGASAGPESQTQGKAAFAGL
jgi:xanthine/CO dehydrogenase XdhC/CoxF family maturation factor